MGSLLDAGSFEVGNIVTSRYTKNDFLFKVVEIERRFLTKTDLKYSVYQGHQLGDEYNPLVTIKPVANLSVKFDASKKLRSTKSVLDAAYLTKVTPEFLKKHIERLNSLLLEVFN